MICNMQKFRISFHARRRWRQRIGFPVPTIEEFLGMLEAAHEIKKIRHKDGKKYPPPIGKKYLRLEDVVFVIDVSRVSHPYLATVMKNKF